MELSKVDNAIVLAAGFGSRFVPITYELPKGLVLVRDEPLLERQLQQLREKGINEIYIVVGYLKEKFEYLIDKYNVQLVYNPEYAKKNNLSSLFYARKYLKNSYILAADNWIEESIFNSFEEKSWYSCVYNNGPTSEWCVKTDDTGRITNVKIGGKDSWVMYGPVFLSKSFSENFIPKIEEYYHKHGTENYMWENVFIDEIQNFDLYINKQDSKNVYEFETLEELRQFDPGYTSSNPILKKIESVFDVKESEITDIKIQKAGMTNKSFTFSIGEQAYVFRLAGEGTGKLISRKKERETYKAIKHLNISDEIVYFSKTTGSKISLFYNGAVNTSAQNSEDVEKSMGLLRTIHQSSIQVDHSFDIENEILKYIKLCKERNAIRFSDNSITLEKIQVLLGIIKKMDVTKVLCHIDSNPDNFIKLPDGTIKLIDWEYAGMCDPVMDISMYSIYSYYTKPEMDRLLRIYLQREPTQDEVSRLYIYVALGGYLWALWTQYKQSLGVEFGEYGMKMYRYAKEYYSYVLQMLEK